MFLRIMGMELLMDVMWIFTLQTRKAPKLFIALRWDRHKLGTKKACLVSWKCLWGNLILIAIGSNFTSDFYFYYVSLLCVKMLDKKSFINLTLRYPRFKICSLARREPKVLLFNKHGLPTGNFEAASETKK